MNEGEPVNSPPLIRSGEGEPDREAGLVAGSPSFIAPDGWKLVPIEPTQQMLDAGKGALYRFIAAIPAEQRNKFGPGSYRVSKTHKFKIRWQAMLDAAPDYGQQSREK